VFSPAEDVSHMRPSKGLVLQASWIYKCFCDLITDNSVDLLLGELPSGGSKSHKAATLMAAITAIMGCVISSTKVKARWCTPADVKKAMGVTARYPSVKGKQRDTKVDVISRVCDLYPELTAIKKGDLEHIADSIGVYHHFKHLGMIE